MRSTIRHNLGILYSLSVMLFLMVAVSVERVPRPGNPSGVTPPVISLQSFHAAAARPWSPLDLHYNRVAQRMAARITRDHGTSPPLFALLAAMEERSALLRHHVTATLENPVSSAPSSWEVNLHRYPTWMKTSIAPGSVRFTVDTERIREYLTREPVEGVTPTRSTVITAIEQEGDVERVVTSTGAARSGIVFDLPSAASTLAEALAKGTKAVSIPLITAPGPVINISGTDLGALTLLGTGKSDFKGSPAARAYNIRKAIDGHVNNVLVRPGATFSFNATLEGPVSEGNGWRLAKVIFNTTDLVMAPGGGICQASTTVFRAMLQAGLVPVQRANHSMYVSYYEKYGVGIDATIFPGKQDLTFVNDTGNPLLLQAFTEGTEVIVSIYGTPDGRTTRLNGPYFSGSDLSLFPATERPPRSNEIAWVHSVTGADGSTREHVITSRYVNLPRSLAKKYADTLRASAPEPTERASVSQR